MRYSNCHFANRVFGAWIPVRRHPRNFKIERKKQCDQRQRHSIRSESKTKSESESILAPPVQKKMPNVDRSPSNAWSLPFSVFRRQNGPTFVAIVYNFIIIIFFFNFYYLSILFLCLVAPQKNIYIYWKTKAALATKAASSWFNAVFSCPVCWQRQTSISFLTYKLKRSINCDRRACTTPFLAN